MLKKFSIRFKIILGQVVLIAIVAVFIYSYYPRQQEEAAIVAIGSKIRSISNLFSVGVGIGMGETDFVAVSEAVGWAKADSALIYISVVNTNNQTITSLGANEKIQEEVATISESNKMVEINETVYYSAPIIYQGMPFGTLIVGYSLKQMHATIRSLKTTTLYFCIGLFASGVILSVIISNRITGSIRRLDSTVKAISNGAENLRVTINGNDEIGQLGKAFNSMLMRLDHSRADLVKYSEQLKKQNEELNQFSYVVSHDLKAPLRAIFKLSEWIEEDLSNVMSDETKKNMTILRGRVFRMEALINGLLQYSKIGRINVPTERLDVHAMLKDTIDLLNPPPHITISIQKGMPVLETKKFLLQQVFMNLLSNAIKYNDKPEGTVNISVTETVNYYRFTIEDNGIGIDKAYHEKVFEIFQTLQSRDKVEGTGVGLSIIKKSVEDMGGVILLESEETKGARFIFTWPKAA